MDSGALGGRRSSLGVLLHETAGPKNLEAAVAPLVPVVLQVVRFPSQLHAPAGAPLLDWLSRQRAERPLLGLTGASLSEPSGHAVRGLSLAGRGVALVSTYGLGAQALVSVVRHELGHALGLEHCDDRACALSARAWPLGIEDRGDTLCARCETLWRRVTEDGP